MVYVFVGDIFYERIIRKQILCGDGEKKEIRKVMDLCNETGNKDNAKFF
ncbi:hypothetical protein KSU1_B0273 [Candidatus Jettenia caeni]|uniref:Uncharacterized protein n=1 Tax=Candidatus Jettenia caeni TaxID=247490 RepID=I3IHD5_9BACT|nr:hypothetical protein KSU1_B0273 [Candidatus Jettenia caeni]